MSSVMPRIVMAFAMVTLGWLCWRAGRIEGRMAEADRELATLRYAPPLQSYDEIDDSVGSLDRMLQALLGRSSDAERRRATARYWLAEFDTLLPARDVAGQPVHDDPVRLLVGANAVYRATVRAGGEPEAMADRLQDATDAYADVLRADPTQVDAAYNYEFVARLRDALARGRQPPHARPDAAQSGTGPGEAGRGRPTRCDRDGRRIGLHRRWGSRAPRRRQVHRGRRLEPAVAPRDHGHTDDLSCSFGSPVHRDGHGWRRGCRARGLRTWA